ncbi:hypothetical protein TCE0_060f18575 [Talaromyces pinophilus]|uniref:Nephrocystin 3-like N-terminal domain-containing protein n=1 Tax=Talaromyces pinophilus TaxID=128442 RepID=A0A6V8HNX4_TALPI|nr:hypothetical protein TCE0_060f18575 [Talaromyces pinophilus]
MNDVTTPTEIARSATACKEVLDMHALEHTWIRSAQVDFNLWCSAIKATSFDKSGMDHRLRNYPDARESICILLDALKTSVEGAMGIYNGTAKELTDHRPEDSADDIPDLVDENGAEAPAWEGELEDSDSTQETDEVQSSSTTLEEPNDEDSESVDDKSLSNSISSSTNHSVLEEYISYVRTILDQLTRISLTIRRAGAKYRFEKIDKALKETEEVKAFRQHLTAIINSGFPDKDAEVLPATEKMKRVYDDSKFSPVQLKLIHTNILRRHRIEHFTKARAPRTRAPAQVPNVIQVQKPDETPAAVDSAPRTSILSSKVEESQPLTPIAPQVHEAPVGRAASIYTAAVTATEVGPNLDITDLSADKTPSRITRMTKIGGSLAYPGCPKPQSNGTLICPYCNDKLPDSYAKNEQSWRAHVAQDILPYTCIMEECSSDNEMYSKSDQLLAHMKTRHPLTKWACNPCSTNTKQASESDPSDPQILIFFDSAESWQAHTEKEHGNLGPAPQRDILTELSQRQFIGPLECPLCKSEPTEPRTAIDEHILKHLHEFALLALPGDAAPANEKESSAFQVSSSASLLSYTKDSWTVNVGTPYDDFPNYKMVKESFEDLEARLERFEPEFSKKVRTGLGRCWDIMERRLQDDKANVMLQIYGPPFVNLMDVCNIFSYADKLPQIRNQLHQPSNITLEMEQDILNAALERVFDLNDGGIAVIEDFLDLLKRRVKYPINFSLPSPGRGRVNIDDIAEKIDTGLTNDTGLTRHSNKYKNSPMLLGEEFRKPTKDNVELARQLSLLPNFILTGHDPDQNTETTVELVNELKERVEDWSILWVDARSVASIQKSCVQILETLVGRKVRDRSGDETFRGGVKIKALFHYLSWTYEGLWIMVFDGLEAEGAIYLRMENMFPRSCSGTLIISTTDPTSAKLLGLAEVIQLPEVDLSLDRKLAAAVSDVVDLLMRRSVDELGATTSSKVLNTDHGTLLDWIRYQRLSKLPPKGSIYDEVLARAELFMERLHSFDSAIEHFASNSYLATKIAYGYCAILLEVQQLGEENWSALSILFGFCYSISMGLVNLPERIKLFAISQEIKEQLVSALTDLIKLVAGVSTYFYRALKGFIKASVSFNIYEMFLGQIESFRDHCDQISHAMWKQQLLKDGLDGELVSEIKSIQQWLAPEDRVLAHFAKNTPHLAQDREEFTCLWLDPYLSRFLKSQQLKGLSISGTPGAGKTVLASVIVDHLQHPFGDIIYDTVFVSINTCIMVETAPQAVIKVILRQLFDKRIGNTQLFEILSETYDRSRQATSSDDYEKILWDALQASLEVLRGDKPLVILVDGLDEVSGTESAVLEKLQAATAKALNLKLIALGSQNFKPAANVANVHITPELIFDDIAAVVRNSFEGSQNFTRLSEIDQEILVEQITQAANGSFLWAKLAAKLACDESSAEALQKFVGALTTAKLEITDLVIRILETTDLTEERKLALVWLATVDRPLSQWELSALFSIQVDRATVTDRNIDVLQLLKRIRSLVKFQDGYFSLQHDQIRSAIVEGFSKGKLVPNIKDRHADLLRRILIYAHSAIGEDHELSLTSLDHFETNKLFEKHILLDFSLRYWVSHFRQTIVFTKDGEVEAAKEFGNLLPTTMTFFLLLKTVWDNKPTPVLLPWYTTVTILTRTTFTTMHPATLQSIIILAQFCYQINLLPDAGQLFYEATRISRTILTAQHIITIQVANLFLEVTAHSVTETKTDIMTRREEILILLIEGYRAHYGVASESDISTLTQLEEHYRLVNEDHKAREISKEIYHVIETTPIE